MTYSHELEEFFFNLVAAAAGLLTIYGFIASSPWKFVALPAGLIALGFYIRWYVENYLLNRIMLQNHRIQQVDKKMETELAFLKSEVSYVKGWMSAINHFRGKKGGAIDPVTLVVAIIIIILFVLYFQGKLS